MNFILGVLIIIALAALAYGAYESGGRQAAEREAECAQQSAMRWRNAYYAIRPTSKLDGTESAER